MAPPRTPLALDFDWSLIEENSDTFVIRELGADAIYQAGRERKLPWTQLMDHVLAEAAAQLGRTPADVTAALHRTPLHPALADVLRRAAAAGDSGSSSGAVDTVIVSDANTVYIDTILQHHSLRQLVLEVHTNPAEWRGGALRVAPLHGAHPHPPHGCPHCPTNLCKGKVLRELLEGQRAAGRQYSRILYVGDGRGDYCPSVLLLHGSSSGDGDPAAADAADAGAAAAGDGSGGGGGGGGSSAPLGSSSNRLFAREEYPDGLPCSLWVMLRNEARSSSGASEGSPAEKAAAGGAAAAAGGAPRVVPWSRPEQLAALLVQELQLD